MDVGLKIKRLEAELAKAQHPLDRYRLKVKLEALNQRCPFYTPDHTDMTD